MKNYFYRFVASILVLAVIGADPSWANGIASALHSSPTLAISQPPAPQFLSQALQAIDLAPGNTLKLRGKGPFWTWPLRRKNTDSSKAPKERINKGRRLLLGTGAAALGVAAGAAVMELAAPITAFAQSLPASPAAVATIPSLQDAQSRQHLMRRFVWSSPAVEEELGTVQVAETKAKEAVERDVKILFSQNDLTHSPRWSVAAFFSLTALKANLTDTIARSKLVVEGRRQPVESLRQPKDGFWANLADWIKTLSVRGGVTKNSDAIVLQSLQRAYFDNIDRHDAAAHAFQVTEDEWLRLDDAWYELAALDADIQWRKTQLRFNAKSMGELTFYLHQIQEERHLSEKDLKSRLEKSADEITMENQLQGLTNKNAGLSLELSQLEGRQRFLPGDLVYKYLKGNDAAAGRAAANYHPQLPPVDPTLASVRQILLSDAHPQAIDPGLIAAFRTALLKQTGASSVPADPLSPESRRLIDRAWKIPGWAGEAVPANTLAQGSETPLSLHDVNEWAEADLERLKEQAKASPKAAEVGFQVERYMENIESIRLGLLPQYYHEFFIKLGIDFPAETQNSYQRTVETGLSDAKMATEKARIAQANRKLNAVRDENDRDVQNAYEHLVTTRKTLRVAARGVLGALANVTAQIDKVNDAEQALEEQIYNYQKSALALDRAYQRLHYYLAGRDELRTLFDQRREAFLTSNPTPKKKAAKPIALLNPATGAGLLSLAVTAISSAAPLTQAAVKLYQYSVWGSWMDWGVMGVLIMTGIFLSHFPWFKSRNGKDQGLNNRRLTYGWAAIAVLLVMLCPLGFGPGLAAAFYAVGMGWLVWYDALTTSKSFGRRYNGSFFIDRHRRLTTVVEKVAFVTAVFQIIGIILKAVEQVLSRFVGALTTDPNGVRTLGAAPIRFPLTHTVPLDGELVYRSIPDDGVLNLPYLVRWILPGQAIPHDAHFVFQMRSGLQDQITQAEGEIAAAEAEVRAAVATNPQTAATANAKLAAAQTKLAAARHGLDPLQEPLVRGGEPVLVDPTWPPLSLHESVKSNQVVALAELKSPRAAKFQLTLSPEQAVAIGKAATQPTRNIYLRFKNDSGESVYIPGTAIRQMTREDAVGSAINAFVRDLAKGGIKQVNYDLDVLVSQSQVDQHLVPTETLQFLSELSQEQPGKFTHLELDGFEEWVAPKDHREFKTEPLKANQVLAMARAQVSGGPPARSSSPQETAAIASSSIDNQIAQYRGQLAEAQKKITELGSGSLIASLRRIPLIKQISDLTAALQNLEQQQRDARATVHFTGDQGTSIGPRQVSVRVGDRLVFAAHPIARMLNLSSQHQTALGLPSDLPEAVQRWDAHELSQIGPRVSISVHSALDTSLTVSAKEWPVLFPTQTQPVVFKKVFNLTISDPVLNLSTVGIDESFSLDEALSLLYLPNSDIPVILDLPSMTTAPSTPEDHTPVDLGWLKSVSVRVVMLGLVALTLIGIRLRMRKRRNARAALPPKPQANELAIHDPDYGADLGQNPLFVMSESDMNLLAEKWSTTYFEYERADARGAKLAIEQVLNSERGDSVLSVKEGKTLIGYYDALIQKEEAGKKHRHSLWIALTIAGFFTALAFSQAGLQIIRLGLLISNQSWIYIGGQIPQIHLTGFLDWHLFLSLFSSAGLQDILTRSLPAAFLGSLVFLVFFSIGKAFAETIPPLWARMVLIWYVRFKRVHAIRERFYRATAYTNPEGHAVSPKEAVLGATSDPDNPSGKHPMLVPDRMLQRVYAFGEMITDRAVANLQPQAERYWHENPLSLYEHGESFFTEARRRSSEARWFANALYTTAQCQGTPQALIPAGSELDKTRLEFDPQGLVDIAIQDLGMDMIAIEEAVAERISDRAKRQEQVLLIRDQYLERALVFWAIHEAIKRPIPTLYTVAAFDQYGIVLRPTASSLGEFLAASERTGWSSQNRLRAEYERRRQADTDFTDRWGSIQAVLDEFHKRLPTLARRTFELREKYVRENKILQLARYLDIGFGEDPTQRLNATARQALIELFVDSHGTTLLRSRSRLGVPTFEGLLIEFCRTGTWDNETVERLLHDLREALITRLDYSPAAADQKISEMQAILEAPRTRLYAGWLVARRLARNGWDNFLELFRVLVLRRSRDYSDSRQLEESAPMMDALKLNQATNSDLLAIDLRYGLVTERLLQNLHRPILGNIDLYFDLALEITLRDAGIGLQEDKQSVGGEAIHLALSTAVDDSARTLSRRVPSRVSPGQSNDVHVFTSAQANDLLLVAGRSHEGSEIIASVEPGSFDRVVDPDQTDDSLYVVGLCNPYVKHPAQLVFEYEMIQDAIAYGNHWDHGDEDQQSFYLPRRHQLLELRDRYQERDPEKVAQFERRMADIYALYHSLDTATQNRLMADMRKARRDLQAMNVQVRIFHEWDPEIETLVPAEDDDKSYNTIVILYPYARRFSASSKRQWKLPPDTEITLLEQPHLTKGAAGLMMKAEMGNTGINGKGATGANYFVRDVEGGIGTPGLERGHIELRLGSAQGQVIGHRRWLKEDITLGDGDPIPAIYHTDTVVLGSLKQNKLGRKIAEKSFPIFRRVLNDKGIVMCNIEDDNKPSVENITGVEDPVTHRHYKKIGDFISVYIPCFHPQPARHGEFRAARESDKNRIIELLKTGYSGHELTEFDTNHVEWLDSYYVWEEGGRIVAAMSAKRMHWEMTRLFSNMDADVTIPVLRRLPYLNRVFNLGDLHFLKVGNIAFEKGHQSQARALIEAGMAEKGVRSSLAFFDPKSSVYKDLKHARARGWLGFLKGGTFGLFGLLDLLQRTKLGTYAIGLDDESQARVDARYAAYTALPEKAAKKPLRAISVAPYRLAWWLTPFILVGSLFGIHTSAQAATLAPSSIAGQAIQHAIQNTTGVAIDYIAQPGDGWIRMAHHLSMSVDRLKALNPNIIEAAKAQAAHAHRPDLVNMVHLGDHLHTGLTTPGIPSVNPLSVMHEQPISHWGQWLLHPTISPEWLIIGGLVLLATAIVYFVWRHKKRSPETPVAAWSGPSRWDRFWLSVRRQMAALSMVTVLSAQTGAPISTRTPPDLAAGSLASAPPALIHSAPKEKKAAPWITRANRLLQEAQDAHNAALHPERAVSDETDPAVTQLRKEYAAHYNVQKAQALSRIPLTDSPVKKPAAHPGLLGRWGSRLKPIGRTGLTLLHLGNQYIGVGHDGRGPDAYDPTLETIRAKIIALIGSVKLAQENARTDLEKKTADARAEQVHADLVTPDKDASSEMPGAGPEEAFEKTLDTETLWNTTPAGSDHLAEDEAGIADEAARRTRPIVGTERMTENEKIQYLDATKAAADQQALAHRLAAGDAQAHVDRQLALADHLRSLGMTAEAAQAEEQAQTTAQAGKIQIDRYDLFRENAYGYRLNDPAMAEKTSPHAFALLDPYLKRSAETEERFQAAYAQARQTETEFDWKRRTALALGMDPQRVLADEQARLTAALQEEADARTALKAAGSALETISDQWPDGFAYHVAELPQPTYPDPDDATMENYRNDLIAKSAEEVKTEAATGSAPMESSSDPLDLSIAPSREVAPILVASVTPGLTLAPIPLVQAAPQLHAQHHDAPTEPPQMNVPVPPPAIVNSIPQDSMPHPAPTEVKPLSSEDSRWGWKFGETSTLLALVAAFLLRRRRTMRMDFSLPLGLATLYYLHAAVPLLFDGLLLVALLSSATVVFTIKRKSLAALRRAA